MAPFQHRFVLLWSAEKEQPFNKVEDEVTTIKYPRPCVLQSAPVFPSLPQLLPSGSRCLVVVLKRKQRRQEDPLFRQATTFPSKTICRSKVDLPTVRILAMDHRVVRPRGAKKSQGL